MSILTDMPPAEVPVFDDRDFLALAEEVENLTHIIGELIKVANSQHDLIGILMDEVLQ